jgi:hypothetical protein
MPLEMQYHKVAMLMAAIVPKKKRMIGPEGTPTT